MRALTRDWTHNHSASGWRSNQQSTQPGLFESKLTKVKNSVPQMHPSYSECSMARCGSWLPYGARHQYRALLHSRKFYWSVLSRSRDLLAQKLCCLDFVLGVWLTLEKYAGNSTTLRLDTKTWIRVRLTYIDLGQGPLLLTPPMPVPSQVRQGHETTRFLQLLLSKYPVRPRVN